MYFKSSSFFLLFLAFFSVSNLFAQGMPEEWNEYMSNPRYVAGLGQCSLSQHPNDAYTLAGENARRSFSESWEVSFNYKEYRQKDRKRIETSDTLYEMIVKTTHAQSSMETSFSNISGLKYKSAERGESLFVLAYIDKEELSKQYSNKINWELKEPIKSGLIMLKDALLRKDTQDADKQINSVNGHLKTVKKYQDILHILATGDEADSFSERISDARLQLNNLQAERNALPAKLQAEQIAKAAEKARKEEIKRDGKAFAASFFIPGLGQMLKGHHGHGWGCLIGEVGFAGGAVASYYYSQQQLKIMQDPNVSFADYQTAKKNYKTCRISHIVALSAVAAVHVINIFEAIFMDCRMKSKHHFLCHSAIIPTEEGTAVGLGLTLNL